MSKLNSSAHIAIAAASLSLMSTWAAKADTILKYEFSPGSYYNFVGGDSNTVTGSFSYDATNNTITDVSYTRGSDHFNTGSIYDGPTGKPDQVYFGQFGTSDYDVYQLKSSLAFGGTDEIVSGTHPSIYIDAGGSVISAASGAPGAVPEPATWAMLILGLGAVGVASRRRRGGEMAAA